MTTFQQIADPFRRELDDDYVGVWQIARSLRETEASSQVALPTAIRNVVAVLLEDRDVEIGEFQNDEFQPWSGSSQEKLQRLQHELESLARDPDIGEIAWLAKR